MKNSKGGGNVRFRKFFQFVSTIVIGMHYCPVGCLFCSLLGLPVFMSLLGFLSISLDWQEQCIIFWQLIKPLNQSIAKVNILRYHNISYLNHFTQIIKFKHFKDLGEGTYLFYTSAMHLPKHTVNSINVWYQDVHVCNTTIGNEFDRLHRLILNNSLYSYEKSLFPAAEVDINFIQKTSVCM